MFRSIRWRLIASYVLLTLLTVSVLGTLGFSLVKQYIERQEIVFLSSNAEAIARQALPYMKSSVDHFYFRELANAASMLGNVRVRIFNDKHELLADSGSPTAIDQFIWVMPPEITLQIEAAERSIEAAERSLETIILSLPHDFEWDSTLHPERQLPLFEAFPKETQFRYVQRMSNPWGNVVQFDEHAERTLSSATARSTQVFKLPIGDADDPLGYVELREGPSFAAEAVETTTRAFLIAAAGALVLAGIVGLLMARRLTAPMVELTSTASQMSEGDLSVRAPEYGKDEIGHLAKQFNRMAERLEVSFTELATERDTLRRFIADASHELRSPLTALRNFIELLQDKAKGDRKARDEFLAEIEAQLNRLEWITKNLLNISRLDAGLTPMQMEELNAGDLLETVAATYQILAEEKEIKISVIQPEPAFKFNADKPLIECALSNLMDNALKFTPHGGQVKLGANQSEGTARLWVRDSGVGIDQEDLPHIFKRFYRGRSVTTEGSGLGLAMVESVIQAHGGRVMVESEPGAGSHLVIELPGDVETVIGASSQDQHPTDGS